MSEPAAPYSPRRPLHLRYVFEHMETGERHTREVTLEEVEHPHFWKGLDNYEVVGRYLSTGLTDAEGREVWEGDVLEGEPWSFADPDPLRCTVRREAWAFVLENGPAHDRDPEGTLKFIREARVVGNIYETAPEPAS